MTRRSHKLRLTPQEGDWAVVWYASALLCLVGPAECGPSGAVAFYDRRFYAGQVHFSDILYYGDKEVVRSFLDSIDATLKKQYEETGALRKRHLTEIRALPSKLLA